MYLLIIGGISEVLRSGVVAVVDDITSRNAKILRHLVERKDQPVHVSASRIAHEEGLETFWDTLISSILTKVSDVVTPSVPHQIVILPGKLLGSLIHWLSTTHIGTNRDSQNGNGNGKVKPNIFGKIYETIIKNPVNYYLKACGLNNEKSNFLQYALSQAGIFSLGSFLLRKTDEELPGVNISRDEGPLKSIIKGLGYTVVEQFTYSVSQVMRYVIDFGNEFKGEKGNKKDVWAKAIANVINERFFPGHILGGIGASLSTYFLHDKLSIPRVTAAALGEFPGMTLSLLNCHRRRATKYEFDYDSYEENGKKVITPIAYKLKNGEKVKNYRFSDNPLFEGILKASDAISYYPREALIKLTGNIFGIEVKKLKESFDISEENLRNNKIEVEKIKNKLPLQSREVFHVNRSHVSVNS